MNLLLLHNNYGVYSGEEAVVDKQVSLFESMRHSVRVYRKTTEGERGSFMGNIKGLLSGFYAPQAVRDIKRILREAKPDVAIIHNLYPFISPAVLKYFKQANVPVIMTVHNFRLVCPTGLFMRNDRPCELCLKGPEWHCIYHNCEHSVLKSIGYAGRNWYARVTKAYLAHVDRYACITKFQIQKLVQAGYDAGKMRHIPNFLDLESTGDKPATTTGQPYVAISGRLSREKGIDLILDVARKTPGITYKFAGAKRDDGDLFKEIPANCIFVGHLAKEELKRFYLDAQFLLIASHCYEGFPMTILEAASYHKPTIGPAHAGFLEIIDNGITGLHFVPSNADDLESKVKKLWGDPEACASMGNNAFQKLQSTYSSEQVRGLWESLFSEILLKTQNRPL